MLAQLAEGRPPSVGSTAAPKTCAPRPQELHAACALVFDGGRLGEVRAGSTILDLTQAGQFRATRRGCGFAAAVQLLTGKYGLRHVID